MAEQRASAPDTLLHVAGRADKLPKGSGDMDRYIGRAHQAGGGVDALIRALAGVAAERELERALPKEVQAPSLTECGNSGRGLGEPAEALARDTLLDTSEAAQCLGVSESFLAKARMHGTGPPYRKLGRSVRYAQRDLNRYLLACSLDR